MNADDARPWTEAEIAAERRYRIEERIAISLQSAATDEATLAPIRARAEREADEWESRIRKSAAQPHQ